MVFNEVLTHPGDGFTTAIELFNTSSNPVTIGNWFLSDSPSNFKKDRLLPGLQIPPYGFTLFTPSQFGLGGDGPSGFVLSADLGGTLYLSESDTDDNLSGRRAMISFGAAESGVSFGRFPTSIGADFVAQNQLSLGASNVSPKVGPVVINELMYHPVTLSGADLVENHDEEYVELFNPGSSPVPLYDPAHPTNTWRLAGGVKFTFPSNTILPGCGYLVVVDFDPISQPAALVNFLGKYGSYGTVVGPYNGHLADEGESIELYKPDAPVVSTNSDNGYVPYVLVDQVIYGNQTPWPSDANGDGMSLQRIAPALYGNEPLNWVADWPTAGRTNAPVLPPRILVQPNRQVVSPGATVTFNVTADGAPPLIYHWFWNNLEVAAGTNASFILTNVQPAVAGLFNVVVMNSAGLATSSNAELVVLTPLILSRMNFQMDGSFQFNFGGLPNQTYAIDYLTNLQSPWMELVRLVATNQAMQFLDTGATNQPCRFYRIRLIMPLP
ncbi:MAG: immunoglobulin domain-containing protein [Verrucomicrobia bacterium]|nr:immunoglobulin domain-containing protein [Verrucomicrobiota bacterium]